MIVLRKIAKKDNYTKCIEVFVYDNEGIEFIFTANRGSIFLENKIKLKRLESFFYVSEETYLSGKPCSESYIGFFDDLTDAAQIFQERIYRNNKKEISDCLHQLYGQLGQNLSNIEKIAQELVEF